MSAGTSTTVGDTNAGGCPIAFEAILDGSEPFAENGWGMEAGKAVSPACPSPLAILRLESEAWTDARFETTMTIDEECSSDPDPIHGAGLMGRIDDSNQCAGLSTVFCIIDVAQNQLYLGIADDSCNGPDNANDHQTPPDDFEYAQEYRLRLSIQGDTAVCRVDRPGLLPVVAIISDPGGVIPQMGSVAVYAENAVATVTALTTCTPS
jgi:hypothetical protein